MAALGCVSPTAADDELARETEKSDCSVGRAVEERAGVEPLPHRAKGQRGILHA